MSEDTISENTEQPNALQEQLQAAQREAAENHDKYLRALAESENTRKRVERLCEDRMWQERRRLVMHLVELADQLEEALKYTSDDNPVANGLRVTYQHLQHVLAQEGAQALKALGETFDPDVHEAIDLTDGNGEPNEVTSEYRKGYMLDGKLLRPARVQVRRSD
jgi:molecular chaperone GrpE